MNDPLNLEVTVFPTDEVDVAVPDPVQLEFTVSPQLTAYDLTLRNRIVILSLSPPEEVSTVLVLPDTFYVQFELKFNPNEMTDYPGAQVFSFGVNDYYMGFYENTTPNTYDKVYHGSNLGDTSYAEYDITPIPDSENHVFDLKFELSGDHQSLDVTMRMDSVVLGTVNTNVPLGWASADLRLGETLYSGQTVDRSFNYFNVGSAAYGDSDLFSADFNTDYTVFPFDADVGDVSGYSPFAGLFTVDDEIVAYFLKNVSI